MKISATKYKAFLIVLSALMLCVDALLIVTYGFDGQFLIFLYVVIGVVPSSGIAFVVEGIAIPTVTINNDSKTVIFDWVANELYRYDRSFRNQGETFHFDEIIGCELHKNKLIIKEKYGRTKTLYLYCFSKRQIDTIKSSIDEIAKRKG